MGDFQKKLFDDKLECNIKNTYKYKNKFKILNFPVISIKYTKYEKTILLFKIIPIYKILSFGGLIDE